MVAAALAAIAVPASAATFTVDGDTSSGATYHRPLSDFGPPTQLSRVGTAVRYASLSFSVSAPGDYDFMMTSTTPDFDPVLTLYQFSFDPANALTNALLTNDDLVAGNLTQAGFTHLLSAGIAYVVVMTGFENSDSGTFTFTIDGPGTVSADLPAAPEPATWAMFIGGFGLIGGAMRRRRRVSVRFG
ncbi:PEPxxWA-CTERM sorting domain-containing protein [Sphingomonas sp. AP4-R1]|uniref:PEPxxWA-CTERM sorting domain-containing protein n=1 Tax=Sphingomonas sp. AP4-R1 TaxID=2735134 RepID=UPI0020A59465|nr:PEPxxWA-CTERM sorting domain-containing protein [Sphingomonas sp. AP4-R1]